MNETDIWNYYMQSGHVNDYLTYLTIQRAKRYGRDPEEFYEHSDKRDNPPRTEYR